jgi:hypothetical protein
MNKIPSVRFRNTLHDKYGIVWYEPVLSILCEYPLSLNNRISRNDSYTNIIVTIIERSKNQEYNHQLIRAFVPKSIYSDLQSLIKCYLGTRKYTINRIRTHIVCYRPTIVQIQINALSNYINKLKRDKLTQHYVSWENRKMEEKATRMIDLLQNNKTSFKLCV